MLGVLSALFKMRSLVLLTTSLGILLHTLLGWCPQHVGCVVQGSAETTACGKQHQCRGHHHRSNVERSGPLYDHGQTPADSDSHSCDHADCLFVSQVESIHVFAPLTAIEYLPLHIVEHVGAVELAVRRANADRLFLPHAREQAARIARGVWLI